MKYLARTVYRCTKCPSEMTTNGAWFAHMQSHLRLEQMEKDLAKFGPNGVGLSSSEPILYAGKGAFR